MNIIKQAENLKQYKNRATIRPKNNEKIELLFTLKIMKKSGYYSP